MTNRDRVIYMARVTTHTWVHCPVSWDDYTEMLYVSKERIAFVSCVRSALAMQIYFYLYMSIVKFFYCHSRYIHGKKD